MFIYIIVFFYGFFNFLAGLNVIFQFHIYNDSVYSKDRIEKLKVVKNSDLFVPLAIVMKKFYPPIMYWLESETKKPRF